MTNKPDGGAAHMTDLTRPYIKAFCETISVGIPSEREAAKAITQLLRQLDAAKTSAREYMGHFDAEHQLHIAANARADEAAGQMRERCADIVWTAQMHRKVRVGIWRLRLMDLSDKMRALPIHEEPKT